MVKIALKTQQAYGAEPSYIRPQRATTLSEPLWWSSPLWTCSEWRWWDCGWWGTSCSCRLSPPGLGGSYEPWRRNNGKNNPRKNTTQNVYHRFSLTKCLPLSRNTNVNTVGMSNKKLKPNLPLLGWWGFHRREKRKSEAGWSFGQARNVGRRSRSESYFFLNFALLNGAPLLWKQTK